MADATPVPQIVLNDTLGAAFIGVVVSGCLFGVSCVQAWYYFVHQSDRWPLKALVSCVMLTDTIHQGLIMHSIYTYTITNWGNVAILGELVPTLLVEVAFNGLTTFLVQCFLAMRIWRLSDRNVWLIVIVVLLILGEFGVNIAYTIISQVTHFLTCSIVVTSMHRLRFKTVVQLEHLQPLSLSSNALAAVGDLVIAASLCTLLHRSRTGFHRSDTIITKLIVFSINTGLLTSLCALASLVSTLAGPTTFYYITFFFCIGRLYTNSLLATLNARKKIRELSDDVQSSGNNISLSSLGKDRKVSSGRQQQNISIMIETKKEFGTGSGNNVETGLDVKVGSGYVGAEPEYESA
ncbi:uncharacterized protein LACBIDRAFT_299960 [Laccaria bicolor S238N-H82]|uniref:Predicted protein n=1 Tax=Laccaria bicolor (strain S238N-H82 / ATCC MYA-4686) TaxID=486041 RepID=B0DFR2_LACBS|nr:uncharacterized protein LACBIDRAFT_299960 [Laccaria bicolor S238N-H82]EDR06505.1 predicted protein [Laccaria bicolor S238N-H82]|eukprot:XP_001882877.1 predicted protein [Laccaria bicolor S238N-H82]